MSRSTGWCSFEVFVYLDRTTASHSQDWLIYKYFSVFFTILEYFSVFQSIFQYFKIFFSIFNILTVPLLPIPRTGWSLCARQTGIRLMLMGENETLYLYFFLWEFYQLTNGTSSPLSAPPPTCGQWFPFCRSRRKISNQKNEKCKFDQFVFFLQLDWFQTPSAPPVTWVQFCMGAPCKSVLGDTLNLEKSMYQFWQIHFMS